MTENFIDVRGARLFFRSHGKGEALLFLHGVQGLPGWTKALERLARRFEVLAPDHPGFGQSDAPDRVDDVPDLAFFYLDVLDALADGRVHVVGHSLGGWIALEMAIRSTARMMSLTLVNAAGIRVEDVPRGDMFIGPASALGQLFFTDEAAATAWATEWQATPELQEAYDKNRYAAAKYTWQPRLYNPKLEKWLHRIDVPTHVIASAEDRLIPPPHAAALAAAIRGAERTVLPGCGHLVDIERPELLADTVSGFIARLRP